MNPWFRFYSQAVSDPKVQRLTGNLFKTWINLLCLASNNDGALPCVQDIAFSLRITDKEASKRIEELVERRLIDRRDDALRPHNWDSRQFKSDGSTERVQRFRDKHRETADGDAGNVSGNATGRRKGSVSRNVAQAVSGNVTRPVSGNVSGNVSETVHETGPDTDTDSDTESSSSSSTKPARKSDDDELLASLKKAAANHIASGCVNIAPIRRLIAEGLDLELEILPAVRSNVTRLSKPLQTWNASFIRTDCSLRERRARSQTAATPSRSRGDSSQKALRNGRAASRFTGK
jgi:hypothetical protein